MRKILVGFIMDGKSGGLDKYLLTFLDTVSSTGVTFDFLTNQKDAQLEETLQEYQARLFEIPTLRHPIKQYQVVCELIKNEQYDMVYLNVSTAIDCVTALAAKRMRVPNRLLHSHSSGNDCGNVCKRLIWNLLHMLCKPILWRCGTKFYGCSIKAGEWLFPKRIVHSTKFEVMYNAVNRNTFKFHEISREIIRKELGLKDQLVVGHVGNFCYVKNYPFLLQVFQQLHRMEPSAVLLLIGEGAYLERVKKQVRKMGLEQSVRFVGWRSDVSVLYQAMDVFVLPSYFEGLPIVGVEAQCCGLPCVMSDAITKEAKITNRCYFLSLSRTPKQWAQFILKHVQRREGAQFTKEAKNYDVTYQKERWKQLIYGEGEIEIDVFGKYHYSNL